jgi:hypothetical protein
VTRLGVGEPGASATGVVESSSADDSSRDESAAWTAVALPSTSSPLIASTDEEDASLTDLSQYSVPLDDLVTSALYQWWQSA